MFLTVTPNSALDKTLFIDTFQPTQNIPARRVVGGVGGKGLDTSVALRCLGQPTAGLYFTAGRTGQDLQALLEGYGIQAEPVLADGETRTAYIIAEESLHRHTHIFTGGLHISPEQLDAFLERYNALLSEARFVIMGGSLPQGAPVDLYRRLVEMAAQAEISTLIDSRGAPLLASLTAKPTIVKMNRDEFRQTFQHESPTLADLQNAARDVYSQYQLTALVVTCGGDGLLACTPEGNYLLRAPEQKAVSAAGAGDVASGTLAWRRSLGDSWRDALMWSAAASAASVLTEATAELRMAEAQAIFPEVVCGEF